MAIALGCILVGGVSRAEKAVGQSPQELLRATTSPARIASAVPLGDGVVALVQPRIALITVVTTGGALLVEREMAEISQLGRAGSARGRLWVVDGRRMVVNLLTRSLEVEEIRTIPRAMRPARVEAQSVAPTRFIFIGLTPSGEFIGRILAGQPDLADPATRDQRVGRGFIVVDSLGVALRQLQRLPDDGCTARAAVGRAITTAPVPFCSPSLDAISANGRFVAHAFSPQVGKVTVTLLDTGGETVFSRSVEYVPVAVSRETKDSAVAATLARLPRSDFRAAHEGLSSGEYYPLLDDLLVDSVGRVWLSVSPIYQTERHWIVLTPQGESRMPRPEMSTMVGGDSTGVLILIGENAGSQSLWFYPR